MLLSEMIVTKGLSKGGFLSDLYILFSKAEAARLGETYLGVELLIWLALILSVVLKLSSAAVSRWREVASTSICYALLRDHQARRLQIVFSGRQH